MKKEKDRRHEGGTPFENFPKPGELWMLRKTSTKPESDRSWTYLIGVTPKPDGSNLVDLKKILDGEIVLVLDLTIEEPNSHNEQTLSIDLLFEEKTFTKQRWVIGHWNYWFKKVM